MRPHCSIQWVLILTCVFMKEEFKKIPPDYGSRGQGQISKGQEMPQFVKSHLNLREIQATGSLTSLRGPHSASPQTVDFHLQIRQ